MNSLLLDLIVPGGRRPPRVIHDVVVGRVDDIQKTDSLNDGGKSVVDTLQQAGDQVAGRFLIVYVDSTDSRSCSYRMCFTCHCLPSPYGCKCIIACN